MIDFNQFLKQARGIQEQIANTEHEGRAGGGLVVIKLTGHGDIKKVSIDTSLLKVDEKQVLEDLIITAFAAAKQKIDQASQNSVSAAFKGIVDLSPETKL
ncbi:MAG: YbaB/EbfC family nucleoid-associated protein [Rickettsiaceae bacterium]|nr:MAG: YbaB/EbfC family nucleoid-associated protein [Rickettsiaceae bacterium]